MYVPLSTTVLVVRTTGLLALCWLCYCLDPSYLGLSTKNETWTKADEPPGLVSKGYQIDVEEVGKVTLL